MPVTGVASIVRCPVLRVADRHPSILACSKASCDDFYPTLFWAIILNEMRQRRLGGWLISRFRGTASRRARQISSPPWSLLRLITNGSFMHRPVVQQAVAHIGSQRGEVWFKLDAATESSIATINGIRVSVDKVRASILACAERAPTWIQTCCFAIDGKELSQADQSAYLELISKVGEKIKGVLLYGLARPSMQPEAGSLSNIARDRLYQFADRIAALGIRVVANP